MKIEEYKSRIDGLLTNTDTALANVGEVYDALTEDLTTRDSLASENEQLKQTIKELRETNIKLYMQSNGADKSEEIGDNNEVDEDQEAVESFLNDLLGVEKED